MRFSSHRRARSGLHGPTLPEALVRCPLQSRTQLVALLVVLLAGCRTAQPTSSAALHVETPLTTARSSDALDCAEIRSARVDNAYEAVMRFRPEFLRPRGAHVPGDPSGAAPMVYVDNVRQGGPDMLRTIPAGAIVDIRYLSATTASDRFGPMHPGGVIVVRTRR